MEEYLDAREGFWKEIARERVTSNQVVCLSPCFLFAVDLISDTGGVSTAAIYDGEGTKDPAVVDLAAAVSESDRARFNPPIFLRRGLYVDVGSNVTAVTVQYLPIRR